jgi:cytochrome c biogenesis protein
VSALRRAWRYLGRTGVASSLLSLLLLFSLLASFLPQLPPAITDDPDHLSGWLAAAQSRYGSAAILLTRLGGFAFFRSPVFWALLLMVALSTLACTLQRWQAAWRRGFPQPERFPRTLFASDSRALSLPPLSRAAVQAALKGRGYRVRTVSEGESVHLRGDRYPLSNLATLVTHLAVLLVLLGYGLGDWLRWSTEMGVEPGQTVDVGHGTGLAIRNDGFQIEHYPDGSAAQYQARVTLLAGNRVAAQGTIRVNEPLRFRGLGIYLTGFRQEEAGTRLALQVARDPGAGIALAGGLLLLAGATAAVYLPRQRIYARLEREQTLLTIRSSGRADEPEAELAQLVEELGQC